jgi:hypothetical protein
MASLFLSLSFGWNLIMSVFSTPRGAVQTTMSPVKVSPPLATTLTPPFSPPLKIFSLARSTSLKSSSPHSPPSTSRPASSSMLSTSTSNLMLTPFAMLARRGWKPSLSMWCSPSKPKTSSSFHSLPMSLRSMPHDISRLALCQLKYFISSLVSPDMTSELTLSMVSWKLSFSVTWPSTKREKWMVEVEEGGCVVLGADF